MCQARTPECTGRVEHRHHRKLRSQGGDNSDANLLPVCSRCHNWIHANPKLAVERGLIVRSWEDPREVEVDKSGETERF
jgi:hypothetical protein